jgi:Flp pilus assembly protein TadD
MMDFRLRACVAWALAALLWAGGCSQNHGFLAKPDDPGPSGAADIKNPLTMARLCESHGQTADAKRLYEEMIQRYPKDPAGYHGLALLYAKQGQFKEADPCFARALALAPNRADLLGDMGYFYHLCSRSQEAERYLRRAVELEPNQPIYGNNLALVLGEQGRDQESLDLFRRFGTEEQAGVNMAFVYSQRGDYAKALELYNRVLTQDPRDHTAAMAILQVARLQDERQRALQEIARHSPPPPAPTSAPPGPADARPAPWEAAAVATNRAPVLVPPDLAGEGGLKPTPRAAAEACSQVSAEVDLTDEETPPVNGVRWPEGALDFDRSPGAAPEREEGRETRDER